ncbi:nicotinamidase/ pyrazinamidase [Pilobolus umbonatus]|nr:nicotinamidase/ pyrazinamidase [Pilobolus umbonatus]
MPSKTALLIVDMQYDFLENGSLAVHDSYSILPVILSLMQQVKSEGGLIIATQDWHPSDHVSFQSNHKDRQLFETISIDNDGHTIPQVLWPDHCVQHSHGADIVKDIPIQEIDHIVKKGTNKQVDSYSAFADNHYMEITPLAKILYQHFIEEVYVVGLAADYCVKMTVLDALKFGFTTYLVTNGTKPVNPDQLPSVLNELEAKGAHLIRHKV